MIVEYEFILKENGRTRVPAFIVDGGYFPEGDTYVGIAANDGVSRTVLDRAALITRLTNTGYTIPNGGTGENDLATAEQIEAHVDTFIRLHNI